MRMLITILVFTLNSMALSAQTHHYQGSWTKLGTTYVFSFDLFIKHLEGNRVEGHFDWKVVRLNEKSLQSKMHYSDRIGTSAKEYFKGTYRPDIRQYRLQGYKKEDPHRIISPDTYILNVDDQGNIGGKTNAHGSWKGRINGKATEEGV